MHPGVPVSHEPLDGENLVSSDASKTITLPSHRPVARFWVPAVAITSRFPFPPSLLSNNLVRAPFSQLQYPSHIPSPHTSLTSAPTSISTKCTSLKGSL